MSISRTVRIVAACALAALTALGVAGVLHDAGGPMRAADTTWTQPVDGVGDHNGAGVVVSPMDTTW